MAQNSPDRDRRIDGMKNKFRRLGGLDPLRECVRYERAKDGTLEHRLPQEFVEDSHQALRMLLEEKYGPGKFDRLLEIVRKQPSKPFVT